MATKNHQYFSNLQYLLNDNISNIGDLTRTEHSRRYRRWPGAPAWNRTYAVRVTSGFSTTEPLWRSESGSKTRTLHYHHDALTNWAIIIIAIKQCSINSGSATQLWLQTDNNSMRLIRHYCPFFNVSFSHNPYFVCPFSHSVQKCRPLEQYN